MARVEVEEAGTVVVDGTVGLVVGVEASVVAGVRAVAGVGGLVSASGLPQATIASASRQTRDLIPAR